MLDKPAVSICISDSCGIALSLHQCSVRLQSDTIAIISVSSGDIVNVLYSNYRQPVISEASYMRQSRSTWAKNRDHITESFASISYDNDCSSWSTYRRGLYKVVMSCLVPLDN